MRRAVWPLLYLGVALAVAGPLLAPGYVFALDHAVGPRSADYYATYVAHNSDAISSKGGYALLLAGLDALMPMWLAQKLLLFLPFFLAGWGAHRLAEGRARASAAASVFAGLLYALGPFAYIRGVSGQTGVLWAYALAPWFLRAWLDHVETRSRRALAVAVLLVGATIVFQAHGAILLAILVAIHTAVRLARAPRAWLMTLRAPVALGAWSLVLNAYWLLPVLLSPETTLSRIGEADRGFFATTSAGLPSVGAAALTLQGFWREGYASPFPTAWLLVVPALVLLLSMHGLRERRRDDGAVALALAGVLGLLLAVGESSRATAWLSGLVWDHVPFMRGFRDAHKLLALLALAYAYLAPVGFDGLRDALRAMRWPRAVPTAALALLLAAPVATAAPLLGGYGGQLGAVDYPAEWEEVERITAGCDGSMVVLPWHLYLDASWVPNQDKRVTQPAKLYFTCPALTSDDLELGAAASQSSSPQVAYVDHWVDALQQGEVHTLGNLLSPVGARYVLLLKESDWRALAPELDAQTDLRLVVDNARLRLYESTAPVVTGAHRTRVVPIETLDDLVTWSERQPLAELSFTRGAVTVEEVTTFTPPPRAPASSWTLDGEEPVFHSLGFAPAFDAPVGGRVRDAHAWSVGALSWSVSFVALAAVALFGLTVANHSAKYPEKTDEGGCG